MLTLLSLPLLVALATPSPELSLNELSAMCDRDGGRLWKRSLCGPTLLVDPATHDAISWSSAEPQHVRLNESMQLANTAVEWNGDRWTMVLLPLPSDPIRRRVLLAHESFHRVQPQLGLVTSERSNAHLDGAAGRTWLRLEWRALARALASNGAAQRRAVEDALLFRAKRHAIGADVASDEAALEGNEGLAEYTGVALAMPHVRDRVAFLVEKLEKADRADTLGRSFAYTTGPAWGTIIDMKRPYWTRAYAKEDLATIAARSWHLRTPSVASADARAKEYDGDAVAHQEQERETRVAEERRALRARFVDGPTLVLPLRSMKMVFDPNGVRPLDDRGNVYSSITITDDWGKVVVTGGALMSPDFRTLTVPANGDGYTLTLADGWEVAGGTLKPK